MRAAELERFRGVPVDDLIGPDPLLLFVGISPGLWTAAVNAHFARPGNRFWPALHRAGIVDHLVDASEGLSPIEVAYLIRRRIGITNLVNVATARADELSPAQLRLGAERLRLLAAETRPAVVAVLGLTAYRRAFGQPKAVAGRQAESLGPCELWVVPNPSGLNAHETVGSLASAYREVAVAAGLRLDLT